MPDGLQKNGGSKPEPQNATWVPLSEKALPGRHRNVPAPLGIGVFSSTTVLRSNDNARASGGIALDNTAANSHDPACFIVSFLRGLTIDGSRRTPGCLRSRWQCRADGRADSFVAHRGYSACLPLRHNACHARLTRSHEVKPPRYPRIRHLARLKVVTRGNFRTNRG